MLAEQLHCFGEGYLFAEDKELEGHKTKNQLNKKKKQIMAAVELPDINQYVTRGKSTQSDLRRQEKQKYERLASVKSVDKFIKNNDLSSVIGRDNNYYPKQLEDQKRIDEAVEVHQNLNALKKSCDDLKRKAQLKERETEKMRKEIDQMSKVEEGYTSTVEQMQKKLERLTLEYQQTKERQNDTMMALKTYEQMLSRMKKDSLIYRLRMNQMELQLNKNLITLNSKSDESQKLKEDTQKAEFALQEVVGGIELQNQNREKNLQRFKDDLRFKQEVERKREDRVRRQAEIAEVAANDIRDSNLKKWRKLLLVHKFLNQFLRLKMQREIKKFSSVEQGFQKIKAATGVTDANEIVRKFLGREQTYSHLLISIAEYEKRIDNIRRNNEDLRNKFDKLKSEFVNAERPDPIDKRDTEQDKQVNEIEEKALQSSLLNGKLSQWIEKNLTKLARVGLVEVPDEELTRFPLLIGTLKSNLLTMQEEEQVSLVGKQIRTQREEVYESEFQRRNVRVKPSGQRLTQGNSFSHERNPSAPDEEPNESSQWEQISKIDEDDGKQTQEEDDHFKNLRDEVKVDIKKRK